MVGRELSAAGVVVVSGLARGVDSEAHRGALEAEGHTVAVLGCGIDRDYPVEHASLARQIAERSLLASEYGPGSSPRRGGSLPGTGSLPDCASQRSSSKLARRAVH